MVDLIAAPLAALLGLAVGSFLNVLIHRLPLGGSVVHPASRCPSCGQALKAWDNVPVASWLVLGGRCRSCRSPISWRYPLVEIMTAALFWLAVAEFGVTLAALGAALLGALGVVTVFVDVDHLLILDWVTIPAGVAALLLAVAGGRGIGAVEGAALGAALFGLIYVATRGMGMGLGDVKLAACLGAFLGLTGSVAAFVASFVIGALLAVPVIALRRRGRRDVLPFGPFLVLGALIMTFAPGLVLGPFGLYQHFLYRHLGGG